MVDNFLHKNNDMIISSHELNAIQGDVQTMYHLAIYYEKEENYQVAIKYYQMAADKGDPNAMNTLGYMYQYGKGTDIDYPKAVGYYVMANQLNQKNAMINLGILFEEGIGVKQDYQTALHYYKRALSHENWDALLHISYIYANGLGIKADKKMAELYYQLIKDSEIDNKTRHKFEKLKILLA